MPPATEYLSAKQLAWLAEHPVIRVAPDPDFPPIEKFDSTGILTGLAADYLTMIEKSLGTKLEIVRCQSWDDVLARAEARQVDMLSAAAQTPGREEFLKFTQPHIVLPGVLITRTPSTQEFTLDQMDGMRICVVSGYLWQELIARDYPQTRIDPVPDVQTGMRRVAFGLADAFVENLATATWFIEQEGITNLAVGGETPYETRLSFAVRTDWPEFQEILNTAIQSIPDQDKKEIKSRWIRLSAPGISNETRVIWFALGILLLISLLVAGTVYVWNRILQRRVDDRTTALRKELAERKRMEEALATSEAKYRDLVQSVNSVILKIDTSGTIQFLNEYAERLLGFSSEELVGKPVVGTIVPEHDSQGNNLHELIADVFVHPEHHLHNENENTTKDGRRLWFSWANRPIYDTAGKLQAVLCVGSDISARKRAEQALAQSERLYRYLFEESPAGSIIIGFDGIVRDINRTLTTLLQYDKDDIVGRPAVEFVVPEERESVAARLKQRFTGASPQQEETPVMCRDGSVKVILFSRDHAIIDENGTPCGVLLTGIDITERIHAAKLIKEQEKNLIQADKMATLGILVSGVAHEINNPNNFIMLNSQNLLEIWRQVSPILERAERDYGDVQVAGMEWEELRDEVEKTLKGIGDGTERIEKIVRSLKDFARQESGRMDQKVCLNKVVESSLVILANMIKKSTHKFHVEYAPDLPPINGNFQRIEQVVINLVSNACQSLTDMSQSVTIHTRHRDDSVQIVIRDQGCGIDKEDLGRVFDPFYTTKRDNGGTGLGLSISYTIVQDHKGSLLVDSSPGEGSEVLLKFPVAT